MIKVLKNRNFIILYSGQLVSTIGNNLYSIALPWYVYVLTGSKLDLTLTGLATFLPKLASIFAGVFVDRWPKQRVMVWSDLLRAVMSLGMFVVARLRLSFVLFLPLVVLLEFVGAFFSPASGALLPRIVPGEELPEAMGLFQSGRATSQLLGTVAGGGLITLFGAPLLFLGNACSFAVSVISLMFIRVKEEISRQKTTLYSQWWEGMTTIARSKMLMQIISAAMIANFGFAPLDIVFIVWVKGPLKGNAFTLSLIFAVLSAGMIIGGMSLGQLTKRLSSQSILRLGLFVSGISVAMTGFWPDFWWSAGLMLVCGFTVAAVNGSLSVLLISATPISLRGRISGAAGALMTIAAPLGLAVFGFLMVRIPLQLVFLLIGIVIVAGGISCLILVRNDLELAKSQQV